ncbi:MAG: hypothetical protein WC201_01385 [Bacilli bacterium]
MDKDDELKAIEEAIDSGSVAAYSQLGNYYENRKKFEKAFQSYYKGYKLGSHYGAFFIARMFENGLGMAKEDRLNAHIWDLKAADMGNSASQYYVAYNFSQGEIVEKNLQKALHYYTLASENGDFDAALFLGLAYKEGGELTNVDATKSEKHLFNAVKNATNDEEKGSAYNELSILYLGCLGENPSSREFLNRCLWFMNAAVKLGDKNAIENSKKSNSILIIDERAKNEVSKMIEPNSLILPKDFYNENFDKTSQTVIKNSDDSKGANSVVSDYGQDNQSKMSTSSESKTRHEHRKTGLRENITDEEVIEFNGIVNRFLTSLIIKLVLFSIGLGIILYFYFNFETYGPLSILFYIIGVIIAGFPGLFKSLSSSINISKKVDRFFGTPQYKGTVDSEGNVRIKDNTDWIFILFRTFLNLIYYALFTPFEFLIGIIKVIIYKHRINIYWSNKE